jgi:hypothetical protein
MITSRFLTTDIETCAKSELLLCTFSIEMEFQMKIVDDFTNTPG